MWSILSMKWVQKYHPVIQSHLVQVCPLWGTSWCRWAPWAACRSAHCVRCCMRPSDWESPVSLLLSLLKGPLHWHSTESPLYTHTNNTQFYYSWVWLLTRRSKQPIKQLERTTIFFVDTFKYGVTYTCRHMTFSMFCMFIIIIINTSP